MVEVGLCGISPDDELPRRAIPDEFSADEVRAALVLTRRAADAQFSLAYDLVTRLPTLLGHDEYPAELAGWGPVHAELARDLATTMACGQWRFAITDEHGHLLNCGITQARPTGAPIRSAGSRQIVELQVPAATLRDLASGWAPVLTDLAHQHTAGQRPPAGDPTRRFPGAALRR